MDNKILTKEEIFKDKVLCKDCVYYGDDHIDPIYSKCLCPELEKGYDILNATYVSGDIKKRYTYCYEQNSSGDCTYFKKRSKEIKSKTNLSFWQRLSAAIRNRKSKIMVSFFL